MLVYAINILSWNEGTKITFYSVPQGAPWHISASQTETVWVGTTNLDCVRPVLPSEILDKSVKNRK